MNFDTEQLDREAYYLKWKEWFYDIWLMPEAEKMSQEQLCRLLDRDRDFSASPDYLPAEWNDTWFCPWGFQ